MTGVCLRNGSAMRARGATPSGAGAWGAPRDLKLVMASLSSTRCGSTSAPSSSTNQVSTSGDASPHACAVPRDGKAESPFGGHRLCLR